MNALKKYMHAFTTALKKQPFNKIYIDAFAGSGQHEQQAPSIEACQEGLFGYLSEDQGNYRKRLHGSPIIALENNPPFDRFIFIEKDHESLEKLKRQIQERKADRVGLFGEKKKIGYLHGDANKKLSDICCSINWCRSRGIIFFDPFALEVRWETLELISQTEALDVWFLFPFMAVNRVLPRDGRITSANEQALNRLWGYTGWKEEIYKKSTDIFGHQVLKKRRENINKVMVERLKNLFPTVYEKPLLLRNSRRSVLFHLYFVCANPSNAAKDLSLKLAKDIISSAT